MNSTLIRTALGVVASGALASTLLACSSSSDESPATTSATTSDAAPTGDAPETGPTTPASSTDEAEITAVFQRYIESSNSGDVQAYLETVCATDPVHSQDLAGGEPDPFPKTVLDITDVAVDGDDGLATVTVKIGLEEAANTISPRFTFVREDGSWTVCGEQKS